MLVSEISLWGAALVACLVFVAMIALAFADSKMLRRMLVIFGATVAQMVIVGAVVCLVYQTFAWWSYLLWYLLILVLSVCWVLFPLHAMWQKMLRPVCAAMLVGSIVVGGSAMVCLPLNVFLSVYSVLMACLTAAMIQTMMNYQRNLHNPEAMMHESILRQIRLMAQPLVMVMPMLYAGMLVGGVSALQGLIVVLLLISATFVANVLAGVVALKCLK